MDYIIVTKTSFENVYHVQAQSKDAAIEQVMNSPEPPGFLQRHLGESIVSVEKFAVTQKALEKVEEFKEEGYF